MQPTADPQNRPRQMLTTPVYASFADGISMATADGGTLVFHTDRERDPADGPSEIGPACLAAVSPVPRFGGEDPNLFALTTAIADEAGRLWERTRIVKVGEIWMIVLEEPMLYLAFERPSDEPRYRNAESVTRRVLLQPLETLCDGRWSSLIEVIRELKRDPPVTRAEGTPYELHEKLLFRLRFHYFGAEIGLLEEDAALRIMNTGELVRQRQLVITIHPHTDSNLILTLGPRDCVVHSEGPRLSVLGKLCSRGPRLGARWESPAWELPRASDLAFWKGKYRELGIDPASIRAFEPNPAIHYKPGSKS